MSSRVRSLVGNVVRPATCHAAAVSLLVVALGGTRVFAQAASRAVFVEHYYPTATIASFTVEAGGALSYVGLAPTGSWSDPIALSPDGRHVAIANGEGDTSFQDLRILRVNADATLSQVVLDVVPTTPLSLVWLDNETIAVTETQISFSYVHTYHFDDQTPALTHLDQDSSGVFNTSLVRHPNLPYLYANDASGSSGVRRFRINPDGTLTFEEMTSTGTTYPLDLAITSDGSWLYAGGGISSGGHAVLGFAVDGVDGSLTQLPLSPFTSPGQSPAYLIVARNDDYLFVGHGTDATVHSFAIKTDGSLSWTGHSFDVGMQGTVGDLAAIDDLLFVTDDSTALDGISGVYSFVVNLDGSFTMIGGINDTFGTRPTNLAAWSPPLLPGDFDGDGDVDLDDFSAFAACFNGANNPPAGTCPPGVDADLDGDGDVDLDDFALFAANYTGSR